MVIAVKSRKKNVQKEVGSKLYSFILLILYLFASLNFFLPVVIERPVFNVLPPRAFSTKTYRNTQLIEPFHIVRSIQAYILN